MKEHMLVLTGIVTLKFEMYTSIRIHLAFKTEVISVLIDLHARP